MCITFSAAQRCGWTSFLTIPERSSVAANTLAAIQDDNLGSYSEAQHWQAKERAVVCIARAGCVGANRREVRMTNPGPCFQTGILPCTDSLLKSKRERFVPGPALLFPVAELHPEAESGLAAGRSPSIPPEALTVSMGCQLLLSVLLLLRFFSLPFKNILSCLLWSQIDAWQLV